MIITVSNSKGVKCQVGSASLLADPDNLSAGGSADLVLMTFSNTDFEQVPQNIVIGPGEYEINGIRVTGVNLPDESSKTQIRTAYSARMDGIRLAFLGTLNNIIPEDALDKLGRVDILFLGAGSPNLEIKKTVELIKQINPSVIIPTAGNIKEIMDELGQKPDKEEKFVVKQKDLEEMNSKLIRLI